MKKFVKKAYGDIAKKEKTNCCGPTCCSSNNANVSEKVGYSKKELESIPDDADMGLGCGNPVALASLKEGEVVVDLGSGGGIDVFLAAKRVGEKGNVIGIDMTEEMVRKARENAARGGFTNATFKLGDIEDIPLDNNTADCVISNCVINLAENKQKVFDEAFRILKSGGRLMVSDMVLLSQLPQKVLQSAEMYAGCIAGALQKEDYIGKIQRSGFTNIEIVKEDPVRVTDYIGSDKIISDLAREMSEEEIGAVNKAVVSVKIAAKK